jgi:hypothetical protein
MNGNELLKILRKKSERAGPCPPDRQEARQGKPLHYIFWQQMHYYERPGQRDRPRLIKKDT